MPMARVLIVDDEANLISVLKRHFLLEGIAVEGETDPHKAIWLMDSNFFDVVISDIRMPGLTGVELLGMIKQKQPLCQVIMLTAFPNMSYVVDCLALGAVDFFRKPVNDPDRLLHAVKVALEKSDRWRFGRQHSKAVEAGHE